MERFPILVTERLILRHLTESDALEIFMLRSHPLVNKYLNRLPSETISDALIFIRQVVENSNLYWAITIDGSQQLVGTICLFDFDERLGQSQIGYELLPEYQGKGIMREALEKVLEYAATELGIKVIEALTHKDNFGSTKLLEAMQFVRINEDAKNPDLVLYRLE